MEVFVKTWTLKSVTGSDSTFGFLPIMEEKRLAAPKLSESASARFRSKRSSMVSRACRVFAISTLRASMTSGESIGHRLRGGMGCIGGYAFQYPRSFHILSVHCL